MVPSEVADVGPALLIDQHVVAMPGGEVSQECDLCEPFGVEAQQTAIDHGDDQESAFGVPAETGRSSSDLGDGFGISVEVEGDYPVPVHVGEPEPAFVPAWTFGKGETVEQGSQLRHRASLLRSPPATQVPGTQ